MTYNERTVHGCVHFESLGAHRAQYTRPRILFHSHRIASTQRRLSLRRRPECVCVRARVCAGTVKSFQREGICCSLPARLAHRLRERLCASLAGPSALRRRFASHFPQSPCIRSDSRRAEFNVNFAYFLEFALEYSHTF